MKTYNEFLESLSGTDPVADARKVRDFVDIFDGSNYALDMFDAFRGLLIDSYQGRSATLLKRYGDDLPFKAEVGDYDSRESCARLIGIWVLTRNASEVKNGVGFNTVGQPEKDYAYEFAMELILPKDLLRMRLQIDRLNEICAKFGVPADMLYRRMKGLKLL